MMIPFSTYYADKNQLDKEVNQNFRHELESLRSYFKIPGLATLVSKGGNIVYESYQGVADIETKTPLDDTVQFPLGSLTGIFTHILIKQLRQENINPANPALFNSGLPVLTLKDLISGVSNNDFGYTSPKNDTNQSLHALKHTTKKAFKPLIREHILDPLKMYSTYFLSDHPKIPTSLARPHIVNKDVSLGHVEYALEEVAGLVSTVRDLHLLNKALDDHKYPSMETDINFPGPILSETSECPLWIYQDVYGEEIMWSYSQMDCYAGLLIKIPKHGLTLILLSNSRVLSDAAKLHFGNIMNSLFAQCFFKYYVNNSAFFYRDSIISPDQATYEIENAHIDHLLAQSLALCHKATYDPPALPRCIHLLGKLFQIHPNYLSYANLTLLHSLCQIKEVCHARKLMPVNRFDNQILEIGRHLLSKDKDNSHINIYLGTFYQRQGRNDLARQHFSRVISSKHSERNWYTSQALEWMNERKNQHYYFTNLLPLT